MKLNSLIIDDEPVARRGMVEYAMQVDFLNLMGECENALEASARMKEDTVDLLFLDIHMPKLSGIDFLKTLHQPPMVIITTAYHEYAIEGYSLDVIDYLVKPIPFERFLKAANKAFDFHKLKTQQKEIPSDYFFVRCNNKYEKVMHDEILYAEAMQNYSIIHTSDRKLITYLPISVLEGQLPKDCFQRVHKSFIVSLAQVKTIDGNEILIGPVRIPISRNLKDEVIRRILGSNFLKR